MKSNAQGGAGTSSEMVILFDDALASSALGKSGAIHAIELETIADLVRSVGPNDHVTVIPLSQPQQLEECGSNNIETVLSWLKEHEPSPVKPEIRSALSIADSILSHSTRFNRELYIASGFYGNDWDSLTWTASEGVKTFLLPVGEERIRNSGLIDVKLISAIRQAGRPVEIEATIANLGDGSVEAAPISVYLEGERVAQASIDVPEGATASKKFEVTPSKSGILAGSIRLDEPDPLALDNRYYFILDIPEEIKLLAVAPDTLTRSIIYAALGGDDNPFVKVTFSPPSRWESIPLKGFDVLLLADHSALSNAALDEVADFASQGGGVIIMPGESSEPAELSRGLLSHLGFGAARGVVRGGQTWGNLDLTHPIFSGVFESGASPKLPTLQFAFDYSQAIGDRVVIPFRSGSPFLLERQVGRGKALLFAAPPQLSSGDFIFSGIFAPLMLRSVSYVVSSRAEAEENWQTGNVAKAILALAKPIELQLVDPNDETTSLPPRPVLGGVEFDAGRIRIPGNYDLRDGQKVVSRFAANLPKNSGRLIRSANSDLVKKIPGSILLKTRGEELQAEVKSSRFGSEFWRPIAFAFMLLLTTESILARPRKNEV